MNKIILFILKILLILSTISPTKRDPNELS
jgi:hypothetical protein